MPSRVVRPFFRVKCQFSEFTQRPLSELFFLTFQFRVASYIERLSSARFYPVLVAGFSSGAGRDQVYLRRRRKAAVSSPSRKSAGCTVATSYTYQPFGATTKGDAESGRCRPCWDDATGGAMIEAKIHYAKSGEVHIAYRVFGNGPRDILGHHRESIEIRACARNLR